MKKHISNKDLLKKIKQIPVYMRIQKYLIVYNAINYPREVEEIAKHLAVTTSFVKKTISEYNRFGISAIEAFNKRKRKNSYMSVKEEAKFMSQYISKAKAGQAVTFEDIKEDFEEAIGKKVHKTAIYQLLSMHNWKEIMTRSNRPVGKIKKTEKLLSNSDFRKIIKQNVEFWRVQKWLIIYNAINFPRKTRLIAEHLAVSKSLVNKTTSEYNRFGISIIETVGKGGLRNSYMSVEEEAKFMSQYISKMETGHVVTFEDIKEDFEKAIGKKVYKTTIQWLLLRHKLQNIKVNATSSVEDK